MNGRFNMLDEERTALIILNLVHMMLPYILSLHPAQFDVRHVLILRREIPPPITEINAAAQLSAN